MTQLALYRGNRFSDTYSEMRFFFDANSSIYNVDLKWNLGVCLGRMTCQEFLASMFTALPGPIKRPNQPEKSFDFHGETKLRHHLQPWLNHFINEAQQKLPGFVFHQVGVAVNKRQYLKDDKKLGNIEIEFRPQHADFVRDLRPSSQAWYPTKLVTINVHLYKHKNDSDYKVFSSFADGKMLSSRDQFLKTAPGLMTLPLCREFIFHAIHEKFIGKSTAPEWRQWRKNYQEFCCDKAQHQQSFKSTLEQVNGFPGFFQAVPGSYCDDADQEVTPATGYHG